MKKLLPLLFFSIIFILSANAQRTAQASPEKSAKRLTKLLEQPLNLTNDQIAKVNAIYFTQATRIDSLNNNLSIDKQVNNLTRRTIVLTSYQKIMTLLTPDQQTKFTELEKEQREKMMQKNKAAPAAMPEN